MPIGGRRAAHRDFRLIAFGNAVSQIGFWAQYVAVGVGREHPDDVDVLIALSFSAQFWPSLILSPVAGLLADRYDRRRLVMFGNLAMVFPPMTIGVLIETHTITLAWLIGLVMVGGAGQAFTQPATVAVPPRSLVPDEELHSAIALNAGLDQLHPRGRPVARRPRDRSVGGPMCSEQLRAYGLSVDFEPQHSRVGNLVNQAAARAPTILRGKRGVTGRGGVDAMQGDQVATLRRPTVGEHASSVGGHAPTVGGHPSTVGGRAPTVGGHRPTVGGHDSTVGGRGSLLFEHPLLKACRREATPFTPIWLMRQAGRYMPEYRKIRDRFAFLEMCRRPDIAAEVTVTAVERLGVDAAIIFADILLPLIPMEVGLHYEKGDGPIVDRPIRDAADLERHSADRSRRARLRRRLDSTRPRRAGNQNPAHRFRRSAVHARVVSDRRRLVAPIPGDQDASSTRSPKRGIA